MIVQLDKSEIPEDMNPKMGDQLRVERRDGQTMGVTVTQVNDENVILDANHPLAGQDLTFKIELVEIVT